MLYRGDDGEMREYQIIETHEHESVFQKACPVLPVGIAIICAILNLFPGEFPLFLLHNPFNRTFKSSFDKSIAK